MQRLINFLEERFFKLTFGNNLLFSLLWLLFGLSTGLSLFMGPVRFFANLLRAHTETDVLENWTIRFFILIFILGSFYLAATMTRIFVKTTRIECKVAVIGFALLSGGSMLWLMLHPNQYKMVNNDIEIVNEHFSVGGYPDFEKMVELKQLGYTAILSFLDDTVIPTEPTLLKREKKNAEFAGLELKSLPMLPWLPIDKNKRALDEVRKLSLQSLGTKNRYYIHCFLGQDRVRMALKEIQEKKPLDKAIVEKTLNKVRRLKNGPVIQMGRNSYIIPIPTKEEIENFLFDSPIKHIFSFSEKEEQYLKMPRPEETFQFYNVSKEDPLSVLDKIKSAGHTSVVIVENQEQTEALLHAFRFGKAKPVVASNLPKDAKVLAENFYLVPRNLSEEEMKMLFKKSFIHNVFVIKEKYQAYPRSLMKKIIKQGGGKLRLENVELNPKKIDQLAEKLWLIKEPTLIQIEDVNLFQAFLKSFSTDLPSIAPSKIDYEILAPNIAVGKEPDFKKLKDIGFRKFLYLGDSQDVKSPPLSAHVDWKIVQPDPENFPFYVAEGGPWYIYGPDVDKVKGPITSLLGPAIPERIYNYSLSNKEGLLSFLPKPEEWKQLILCGPFFVFYTMLVAYFAAFLRREKNAPVAYTRKIFHFMIFIFAGSLKLFTNLPLLLLFSGIVSIFVLYAVYRGHGFPLFDVLARPSDEPHAERFILIPWATTAMGGLTSLFFFGEFVSLGIFVCGFGDAIGEVAGRTFGKHKYKVPSLFGTAATRSIEGSFAVFLMSTAAAIFTIYFMGLTPMQALGVGMLVGIISAFIEAITTHGLDNFTVQVGSAAAGYYIIDALGYLY